MKHKTVYVLRTRTDETHQWSKPTYYRKRKNREEAERLNRVMGGFRTWPSVEKVDVRKLNDMEFADE